MVAPPWPSVMPPAPADAGVMLHGECGPTVAVVGKGVLLRAAPTTPLFEGVLLRAAPTTQAEWDKDELEDVSSHCRAEQTLRPKEYM